MTRSGNHLSRLARLVLTHPWCNLVVLGAVAFVLAASVARAFTYPPLYGGDEPAHFDYVVLVWHGHLPVFEHGLTYRTSFGGSAPVQWVAQHPPLYYLVLAPVVGPLYDGGHPLLAAMAGRMVSALMAGGVVLATAWAAWRCFPAARRLPGAAAVAAAFCGMLIQQGGTIYNDILFVLLSTLACGVAGAALRAGVTWRLLVGAALVGAAGMATRLSFVIWLLAIVVSLVLAREIRLGRVRGWWGRLVVAATPVVTAALASGWYYLRNRALTGNLSGRQAQWGIEHAGRFVHPVTDVATDDYFWTRLFGLYRGVLDWSDPLSRLQWVLLLGPVLLAALIGLVVLVRRRLVARHEARPGTTSRREQTSTWLVCLMLAAVSLLLVVMEIWYVHGGGAPNTRYGLTILPVIAILVGAGLSAARRAYPVLLVAWIAVASVPYLTLVDVHIVSVVPHASRFVKVALAGSAAATLLILVGVVATAVADARRVTDAGRASRPVPDADRVP